MSFEQRSLSFLLEDIIDPWYDYYITYRKALNQGVTVSNLSSQPINLNTLISPFYKNPLVLLQSQENSTSNFRKKLLQKPILWDYHGYSLIFNKQTITKTNRISWEDFIKENNLTLNPMESFLIKETSINKWNLWKTIDLKISTKPYFIKKTEGIKGEWLCTDRNLVKEFLKSKFKNSIKTRELESYIENFNIKGLTTYIPELEWYYDNWRNHKEPYYLVKKKLFVTTLEKQIQTHMENLNQGFFIK